MKMCPGSPVVPRTNRALGSILGLYRALTVNRSPACRFTPSCSQYASEALACCGTRRALSLIGRRLLRCRPGGPFGYDPVPLDAERPAMHADAPQGPSPDTVPDISGDLKEKGSRQ